jgi:dihydrofolate reductase
MKQEITLIAAMAQNRVLGKNNQLIWHIPNDLKHFKELTQGHTVIMGRKTYESMGRPLPKRTNIVISRQANYGAPGCTVVSNLEKALALATADAQPFIIGGAEIYKLALPHADKMELTLIEAEFEGDTFFPEFSDDQWQLVADEKQTADAKNPYPYRFLTYLKA